ncbi:MAG: hydantoinase/oxoprolinase family protein [Candidatus Binatia bacterium]
MQYLVGVDIGGTCTDCVLLEEDGATTVGKAFSTPPDFSRGILDAIDVAAESIGRSSQDILSQTRVFLHSATVAENALVDGTVARAGLITTHGFAQTLFLTRGGYGRWSGLTEDEKRDPIATSKPSPLVPISRIAAVRERTDRAGAVLAPVRAEEVREAIRYLSGQGVESVGIALLWSFVNGENERKVRQIVQEERPDLFVTMSSELAPFLGEYERTSTVALNASLGPVVGRYLRGLVDGLRERGFRGELLLMQAHGGLVPIEEAASRPVAMVESGPVSGLMGCKRLGAALGFENLISADMGGTTFKIGTVRRGLIEYQREPTVLRYHYALPKMDVVSLGLAGGSVVSVDERTGLPRVGPRSAGSYPGPICYAHGGQQPTLTDVDAILGYLNSRFFLGGRARLDVDKARRGFEERIGRPLGLSASEAATAIYTLANSMIHDLVHKTTVQRGLDPRRFALFSTGGTAGMHLPIVGHALGVAQVVVPHSASVQGAFGLVTSDVVHEEVTTRPMHHPGDPHAVNGIFAGALSSVARRLASEGFAREEIALECFIDMRYRRQVHIITVPQSGLFTVPLAGEPAAGAITAEVLERTAERFEGLYKERYGAESTFPEAGIELVTFRVRGTGRVRKATPRVAELGDADPSRAVLEMRRAYVPDVGELADVLGYDFERLRPGHRIPGPAIIWTPVTTVVLGSRQVALCDGLMNLIVTREMSL